MNKQEFKELEKLCKLAWHKLSVTGKRYKDSSMDEFLHNCPACHIAMKARRRSSIRGQDCKLCPIDKWREIAITKKLRVGSCAVCRRVGEDYAVWTNTLVTKDRKAAAKAISKLKWSYLPVYKEIILE